MQGLHRPLVVVVLDEFDCLMRLHAVQHAQNGQRGAGTTDAAAADDLHLLRQRSLPCLAQDLVGLGGTARKAEVGPIYGDGFDGRGDHSGWPKREPTPVVSMMHRSAGSSTGERHERPRIRRPDGNSTTPVDSGQSSFAVSCSIVLPRLINTVLTVPTLRNYPKTFPLISGAHSARSHSETTASTKIAQCLTRKVKIG